MSATTRITNDRLHREEAYIFSRHQVGHSGLHGSGGALWLVIVLGVLVVFIVIVIIARFLIQLIIIVIGRSCSRQISTISGCKEEAVVQLRTFELLVILIIVIFFLLLNLLHVLTHFD
jgi:hypothetical protein